MSLSLLACSPVRQEPDFPPSQDFAANSPARLYKNESVYFAAQSSELNVEDRKKLMVIATQMRMNKTLRARLIGSTEQATKNPSLALRRAIAVRNILSQMGISPNRISVKDETHTDTILSQQHPEGGDDAGERRVDIIIERLVGQPV